jgi:hypothetical protein
MARWIRRRAAMLLLSLNGAGIYGCGAAAVEPRTPRSAEPIPATAAAVVTQEPARPADPAPATPSDSPAFDEAVARLRPVAGEASLAALGQTPLEPAAFANAAIAYATTDVPAMTLIWGMSYGAMAGGALDKPLAQAFITVLNERIIVKPEPNSAQVEYNVRLAPGQMPVRQHADGSVEAPLAYAFEGLFGATLVGFRPPWSVEEFYDVLSSWVGMISTRGTPLDPVLELNEYLVGLARAGHLEAYCFRLLGSAFPAELKAYQTKQAKELKALDAYLKSTPYTPKRAVMPDDLVRLK